MLRYCTFALVLSCASFLQAALTGAAALVSGYFKNSNQAADMQHHG